MTLNAQARITRERLAFLNRDGLQLAGLLERPTGQPRAYALFAHCFTCSKDIGAATRIARALAEQGFAVLRFDFTGLGNSEGDFANTNFSSNIDDLVSAAEHLAETGCAPDLLIGHSLGGAAVLAAAHRIPSAKAVVTIAAPSDPAHVANLFENSREEIKEAGYAQVNLVGRHFTIKRQFLEDIESHSLHEQIAHLNRALLILHSPTDEVVGVEHARHIYEAAKHPKSFISLDRADHLITRQEDASYVADTIAIWASRYLARCAEDGGRMESPALQTGEVLVRDTYGHLTHEVFTESHRLLADEPIHEGGDAMGPSPYEYLLAALGSCTAMTLRLYAEHKQLPLRHVSVRLTHAKVHAQDSEHCAENHPEKLSLITREITLVGDLTEAQRQRMLQIADRCPVHRTLTGKICIESRLAT
ncbi:MAG: alpha/beta fold hydrolase [Gammaproteobacteria bacterium]